MSKRKKEGGGWEGGGEIEKDCEGRVNREEEMREKEKIKRQTGEKEVRRDERWNREREKEGKEDSKEER